MLIGVTAVKLIDREVDSLDLRVCKERKINFHFHELNLRALRGALKSRV